MATDPYDTREDRFAINLPHSNPKTNQQMEKNNIEIERWSSRFSQGLRDSEIPNSQFYTASANLTNDGVNYLLEMYIPEGTWEVHASGIFEATFGTASETGTIQGTEYVALNIQNTPGQEARYEVTVENDLSGSTFKQAHPYVGGTVLVVEESLAFNRLVIGLSSSSASGLWNGTLRASAWRLGDIVIPTDLTEGGS